MSERIFKNIYYIQNNCLFALIKIWQGSRHFVDKVKAHGCHESDEANVDDRVWAELARCQYSFLRSSEMSNISKFEKSAICVRCSGSVFSACNTFGRSSPGENGGEGRSLFLRLEMWSEEMWMLFLAMLPSQPKQPLLLSSPRSKWVGGACARTSPSQLTLMAGPACQPTAHPTYIGHPQ